MADIQANIGINLETANAMARLKALQQEVSNFHTAMAKGSATAQASAAQMQQNLLRNINKTGQFSAQMTTIKTTTESFTNALEKNKLSMGEYFRYAGASTRTFGRLFKSEFETINKVSRERVKTLQTQYVKMGRDASGAMKAMAVRPLALDMDNLATKTMIAAQRQQLFNQLLRQGSTNLLNFGKNTQWAGRQLMVGFTIPLAIFGATAAREFMKLEEQAIRFKRVYGDMFTTSGETERALESVKQLANEFTKYGIAVEETIGLAAKVAQMGNMGDALEAQVTQATRLSVLGGIEQQEALDTTISLTNAFGTEVDDLENKINFLNAAENQTILSIEDFNEAIPKAGSVVKTLGGDVEDLAFFLTAMREGGISASQGANALKSSLGRLINPTDAARKRLAEMGIDVVGIVEANAGNLRGTVMALGESLDALDPLTRARAIEQLFGKFQFARMSTMFANIVKDGSQANKVLQLTTSTTQELGILAERELGKVEDSVAYKFQKSLEQFQAALAPLGEAFIKAVTPLVEFGTKVLNKFNEMGDGAKSFVVIMATILGAVGPVALMTFGLLANGVANVIKMFANLSLGYQRITGQSKSLGISTQYMTQEQLEAAAVAASLNQSHATLIQTFTTEAGTIDRLTAAYNRAIAAQSRFRSAGVAAGPVRGGATPKKYAGGVLSVPGPKGAGDIVPAMLSPGEAVIPSSMAKKYAPLISGMITDNIPGFLAGRDPFDKWHSAPEAVRKATGSLSWATKDAELKAMSETAKKYNLTQNQTRNLGLNVASHIQPETRKVDVGGGRVVDQKIWRSQNLMPDFQATNQFSENMRQSSKILSDFNKTEISATAKKLGITQKEVTKTLDKFKNGIAPSTRNEAKIFREVANVTARNAATQLKDPNLTKTARNTAMKRLYQADIAKSVMDARLKPRAGYYENRPAYDKSIDSRAAKQQETKLLRVRRDLADSTQKNATATKKDTAATAKKTRATTAATTATQKQQAATQKSEKAVNQANRKVVASARSGQVMASVDKNGTVRYYQNGKRISNAAAERSMAASERAQKAAATRSNNRANAGTTPGAAAGEAAARSRIGMGGVSALAAVGAIGASFVPGKVGDVAQQLILPLMMLPMILPLLKNPIVLAMAAIAALGVGIFMLHKKLKEATQSGIDASKAMSMTSEKLKGISEITGTISATELRQRQQEEQLTAVGPEFSSFGIGFVEDSDQGQAMLADIEKQFTQGRNVAEVGDNIGRQLALAISQGVLDMEQSRSIAAALGAELGDYTISTQISGKLTELLGVDGSDLTREPLEIALRIKEDSMKEQTASFEQAMSAINPDFTPLKTGLAAAGSASLVTAVGLAAASVATGGISLIPAAIAGGVGVALNAASAALSYADTLENKEMAGAALQLGIEQLSQNQMLLDSVNQRYAVLKAEAETQEEINRLERNRIEDIDKLNASNAETTTQIMEQAKLLKAEGLYGDAMEASVRSLYEEGTPMRVFADKALENIGKLEDQDFAMSLTLNMASGELNPVSVLRLLELGETNPTFRANYDVVMNEKGSTQTNQLVQILTQNALSDTAFTVMFDLVAQKDEPEFSEALDALAYISSVEARYPVEIDLELNGEENLNNVTNDLDRYRDLPETMTKEAFVDIAGSDEKLLAILDNWEELELTDDIHRQFVLDYIVMTSGDDSMVRRYFDETGKTMTGTKTAELYMDLPGGGRTPGTMVSAPAISDADRYDAAMYYAKQRAAASTPYEEPEPEDLTPEDSGSGTPSSVLDNLLKKLRDVQDATIGVAKGWDAAKQSLDRLFSGGATLAKFSGLEQMMRGMNLGQNLIEMIVGMDPDEFEQRKGELFTFDGAGNITGITTALRNMQLAMNSIALGDFQNKQQETLTTYRNQIVAIDKLVRSGVSLSAAYAAVEDSAFAAAVAQETSNGKIREAAKDAERAAKATRDFAAAQAVVGGLEETANQREIADFLIKNRSRLTNAQVQAIIKDTNLQKLILDPSIDPRAVNQALQDAADQADLTLELNKLTIEGMTDIFNDGFSKAMEKFSAMEQQLTLDFNLRTQDDEDIIKAAEREISTIRYQLDDLEADLTRIQEEEDKINNYYDDRIEALDEVSDINERLAKQQQAQLNIADALSQGDIAAAARARQEYRQQQTSDALEQRKKRIEDSREEAINNIRLENGQSRLEIEQDIFDLQKEIFNIEEESLEPAQRRMDLANQELQDQIDSLTVLGRTREEWARIQNNIDIARTSSDSYTKSIQNALDVVSDILEYWNDLDGKQVTTYHQIVTTQSSTAPPAGGGGSSTSPGNNTGQQQQVGTPAQISAAQNAVNKQKQVISGFYSDRRLYTMPGGPGIGAWEREMANLQNELRDLERELSRLTSYRRLGGLIPHKNLGGLMGMAMGGMFKSVNTDSIPAMLSAGEYVVKRSAVQNFGVDNLEKINNGTYGQGSVYNYNLAVNVKSDADPNKIARTVMSQIKQIDAQRIRSNRL